MKPKPRGASVSPEEATRLVAECMRRAEGSTDRAEQEGCRLYAKLLPVFNEWEVGCSDDPDLLSSDYLTACLTTAVMIVATALRNVTQDDPDEINKLGPLLTFNFTKMLQQTIFESESVGIKFDVGKKEQPNEPTG